MLTTKWNIKYQLQRTRVEGYVTGIKLIDDNRYTSKTIRQRKYSCGIKKKNPNKDIVCYNSEYIYTALLNFIEFIKKKKKPTPFGHNIAA